MEVMNMFKKTTAAIILSAVIMAGSSVSAFAEAPVQTVVVEQEYAASAAKTWDGKAALKAGQKYVIKKNVTVSGKVTLPKGTTLTVKKGAKLTCAVVPLLLASAVLLGSLPMRSFCSNSRLNALSSSLGIWLHRAVYDETTNSMPEGRLSPLRARNTSEIPAIAVTSETIQSGYFRGMVGEVYTGTSWESLPNKELAKFESQIQNLADKWDRDDR